MVRHWIMVGDTTSSGGTVLTGSTPERAGGFSWARVGDEVHCHEHGLTIVLTGDPTHRVEGSPAARHGDFCLCGCILISLRQVRSIVESERGFGLMPYGPMTD